MKNSAKATYGLFNLIIAARIFIMVGILPVIFYVITPRMKEEGILKDGMPTTPTIFLIICLIVEAFLYASKTVIDKKRQQLRSEFQYNEEGLSEKYDDYQKLSKAEREALDKERLADAERILSAGTVKKMTKPGSTDPDNDLKNLIGLDNIKKELRDMSIRMEFDRDMMRNMKKSEMDNFTTTSHHMCFFGPPGTGKTTLAKIVTGYLYRNGYIKYNQYIETDGNFLRSMTPGETSKKTLMLMQRSKGMVLFIDEAYAMFNGSDSQETIATMVKFMEDKRDSFVLIMAGYEKEMQTLIDANPGFFSRFGSILRFGGYTEEVLTDIFSKMANNNNFYIPAETRERFGEVIRKEMREKNFGNARTCRNVLDKAISRHAVNLKMGVISKDSIYTICPEDLV